jgi:hypothetical protein
LIVGGSEVGYGTVLDTFVHNPNNGVRLPDGANTLHVIYTPLVVLSASLVVTAFNQVRGYKQSKQDQDDHWKLP